MPATEPPVKVDWCEASVPGMLTGGNLADETLRKHIVDFLRAASENKLKAAELQTHAASIVQAWVKDESTDSAPQ